MIHKTGVVWGDVFHVVHNKENIFLQVGYVTWDFVRVYEIPTKKFDNNTKEYPIFHKAKPLNKCKIVPFGWDNSMKHPPIILYPQKLENGKIIATIPDCEDVAVLISNEKEYKNFYFNVDF